ncbi:nucleotidyl transferase AbiEii/AbiGii toxin family protein [Foetidibacter luteolus]|uniref:nucleotidyl transferase AbiEii/AbiGii toxin family protein n=1 Tax=Foetidibacter luteolus TaxID=2608880 RepID=UPI001A9881C8|nr:nucleotidyl transferase AbiEii/AbiGii toxin family protein [Foetidibacter luteolus]
MNESYLQDFYLVGGTGLALQLGHRHSIDIDLFTHVNFDPQVISGLLGETFGEAYAQRNFNSLMLFGYLNSVKVDFVNTKVPLLFPLLNIDGIRIADVRDIAILKFQAILKRGSKKDFIDLYELLQKFEIGELLKLFQQKYPNASDVQLLMSMTYFEDAEEDIMPVVYTEKRWEKIKDTIKKHVNKFIHSK